MLNHIQKKLPSLFSDWSNKVQTFWKNNSMKTDGVSLVSINFCKVEKMCFWHFSIEFNVKTMSSGGNHLVFLLDTLNFFFFFLHIQLGLQSCFSDWHIKQFFWRTFQWSDMYSLGWICSRVDSDTKKMTSKSCVL